MSGMTDYGFEWGQVEVVRICSVEPYGKKRGAYRVLEVKTPHKKLEIQVSPTGRSVRVFDRTKGFGPELTP